MRYRAIVIDPPWLYNDSGGRHGIKGRYAGMTQTELLAMPVSEWAERDAHLYIWTTNGMMQEAYELAAGWGFNQKTILTWVKQPGLGMGRYFRNTTEHALFCVRGKLPLLRKDIPTHFVAPPRAHLMSSQRPLPRIDGPPLKFSPRHSVKPAAFFDMVEAASPGPYLEVFARRQRMGWDTWGNECYVAAGTQ